MDSKNNFYVAAIHEIRNTLFSILGAIDLLGNNLTEFSDSAI